MTRTWTHESSATWDPAKAGAFGDLDLALFGIGSPQVGAALGDEWWRAEEDGALLGFGRLDDVWGDAEILVMVVPEHRGTGVGDYILKNLEAEADRRHLNYIYNTVKADHPDSARVVSWLTARGFTETADGAYRKHVRGTSPR